MRTDLLQYIHSRPDLKRYLRSEPYWYRELGRHPEQLQAMEKEARVFNGRTFPQRVARFNQGLGMTINLLNMFRGS